MILLDLDTDIHYKVGIYMGESRIGGQWLETRDEALAYVDRLNRSQSVFRVQLDYDAAAASEGAKSNP